MSSNATIFICGLLQENALQQVQVPIQVILPLGPNDLEDYMVLEVSVEGRNILCILWQAPIRESQKKSLGFGSKSLHSCADYPFFEKQLLVCYWAFLNAELLTMGHQVTLQPEMPNMS